MSNNYKRVLAAKKAVNTLRLNLLSKTNLNEVKQLSEEIISKETEIEDDFSKEAIIAREIGKTTWESFCRYENRRNATKGLILYWISKEGYTLDIQAEIMSEDFGIEITPDDLANFILNYDKGKSEYHSFLEIKNMKKLFKEITGFNWNHYFVKKHVLKSSYAFQFDETNPF